MKELESEAVEHTGVIHIPTGAIAGIDAIKSVRNNLDQLTISTTKNPRSLAGAPYFDIHENIHFQELTIRQYCMKEMSVEQLNCSLRM